MRRWNACCALGSTLTTARILLAVASSLVAVDMASSRGVLMHSSLRRPSVRSACEWEGKIAN